MDRKSSMTLMEILSKLTLKLESMRNTMITVLG
jgi:hypothetical protein